METIEKLKKNGIYLNENEIKQLCEKYHLIELSVFGSAIRDDFNDDSDVDILISFDENSTSTIWDILHLKTDLEIMLNRKVDVIEKDALQNPIRKKNILTTYEVVYAYQ